MVWEHAFDHDTKLTQLKYDEHVEEQRLNEQTWVDEEPGAKDEGRADGLKRSFIDKFSPLWPKQTKCLPFGCR